jgi:hypothetical protein
MKKFRIIAAGLLLAAAASATDYDKYETYLGYSWVKFNPNGCSSSVVVPCLADFIPSFNANGGNGQFVYNFDKWIGVAFDGGAVTHGSVNGFIDATVVSFMAGPRFTWNGHGRFKPYIQALFGGAYSTASLGIDVLSAVPPAALPPGFILPPGGVLSARLVASHTGFAMIAGGGLDIKVGRHVYIRPFEASYFLTRIPNFNSLVTGNNNNQNNFRYSGGVNFMFGGPR